MPFAKHPVFKSAPTPTAIIWRYMNLPKFLSLIQRSAVYMCNLEIMAQTDPFEGTLPPSAFRHRDWKRPEDAPKAIRDKLGAPEVAAKGLAELQRVAEHEIRRAYAYRRSYFINCWHLSEYESSAMWEIYSRRDEGIAIVSSEERINEAFRKAREEIYGGCVNYENYGTDFVMEEGNAFIPVLHKRVSFQFESEYRLVYWDTSVTHQELIPDAHGAIVVDGRRIVLPPEIRNKRHTGGRELAEIEALAPRAGHEIACDVNALIGKVYVSPLAANWFFETVKQVAASYGLKVPVEKSDLYAPPLR